MDPVPLICLGASNPETIRILRAINAAPGPRLDLLGFIDNDKTKQGTRFHGYPVMGGLEVIDRVDRVRTRFVNLITSTAVARHATTRQLLERGAVLGNLIHPNVSLDMVTLGVGHYIQESVILQAEVSLGDNTSIHMGSLIGHESRVGRSVFIAHGCNLSGKVQVGDGVQMGVGVSILPRLTIGEWSIIGGGTVVVKDVAPYTVVVGNPARVLRELDPASVHAASER
jgi:sugar O-acyltransferase (sialic acid O-acetyltransferase NeuD family)